MTFDEVIAAYLSARSLDRRSTWREKYSLVKLGPHFSGRPVRQLKRADIRAYVALRLNDGVAIATIKRELRLFCAAINFAKLEFDLHDLPNPVANLGLSSSEPRVRWITRDQAAQLIQAAQSTAIRPHLPAFIRLALNTGCRKGELLNLEWSRVDESRRLFLLEARHTKQRKRRTVPLNDDALQSLEQLRTWQAQYLPGTPWVFGWREGCRITTFKTGFTSALTGR